MTNQNDTIGCKRFWENAIDAEMAAFDTGNNGESLSQARIRKRFVHLS